MRLQLKLQKKTVTLHKHCNIFSKHNTFFNSFTSWFYIWDGAIWDFQDDVFLVIIVCSFSWSVIGSVFEPSVKAVFFYSTLLPVLSLKMMNIGPWLARDLI